MALGDLSPENPNLNNDAFGRLRVSNPRNIFEWQFRYDTSYTQYWSISSANGGTHAFDSDKACHYMTATTTSGSEAIMQSRRRFEYTPAESQQVLMTFNMLEASAEYQKKVGLFDSNNGLFFTLDGTTPKVVIRSKISGNVVDNAVSQSSWNVDKLDGTGESGLTIDWSKHQLMRISYAFLGIGDVTFQFFINGNWRTIHTFSNANVLTGMYMQSGILPLRFEIKAVGTPTTTGRIEVTCVAVSTEGIKTEIGRVRSSNTSTTPINITTTETLAFAIRINTSYPYSSITPLKFAINKASGNSVALWRIYFNPTLTGGTWSNISNSVSQGVSGVTAVSAGLLLDSGYIDLSGGNNVTAAFGDIVLTDIFLGFDLSNTPDILALTLQTVSGTGSVYFSGQWKEIL